MSEHEDLREMALGAAASILGGLVDGRALQPVAIAQIGTALSGLAAIAAEARMSTPEPTAGKVEWVPWEGAGAHPTGSVIIMARGGYTVAGDAFDFNWCSQPDSPADIVAYIPLPDPPKVTP